MDNNSKLEKFLNQCRSNSQCFPFLLCNTIDTATDVDARVDTVTKLQTEFEYGMQVTTIFPASDAQSLSCDSSDQRPRQPH